MSKQVSQISRESRPLNSQAWWSNLLRRRDSFSRVVMVPMVASGLQSGTSRSQRQHSSN